VRLLADLDAADARAKMLAGTLTTEQLNWKPSPAAWSVGQCLEHLAITNEVYCRAIGDALGDRPRVVVREIEIGWFGRLFIQKYADPVVRAKRRAPGNLIRRARQHDVNRIRFRNPFVPLIRFTVGTGLEIICRHERRHLQQAERVIGSPSFPRREQAPG
jgi:hypothetical protein